MAIRINSNTTALNAHSNLVKNDKRLSGSIERLSSGLRINRASDDAAGLTISEKLRTQVRGLKRAQLNVQDGTSLIQTAEGAMNEITSMLQRMRELALQSANDTLTTTDRLEIQKEIAELKKDVDRISYDTEFNTKKLLDGSGTAVTSTSDPDHVDAIVTGEVLTFSDFSIAVWIKSEYVPGEGQKTYYGQPEVQRSAIFLKEDGTLADETTMLMSVINFIDDNGNFILNDPQTLYIQGDNGQGSLEVSKGLTLGQLTERILGAMTTDQLGHGLGFEGSATEFASEGEHAGQIKVTSGRNGTLGRINFTGSEDLIKTLGFEVITEPDDPIYSVAVTNIGVPVGERKTLHSQVSGHRVGGLIEGIEIAFEPPQTAHVESKPAELGINLSSALVFSLSDSVGTGAGVSSYNISIPAGVYSLNQIVDEINTQIGYPGTNIYAKIGSNGGIEFTSINLGSSAWARVSGLPSTPNELGIVNGTYYGSGGTSASTIAYTTLTGSDFDFSATPLTFTVSDLHDQSATITLDSDYNIAGNGMEELVNAINGQMGGLAIVAEIKDGLLQFRSKETGYDSGFSLTAATPSDILNRLKISVPTASGIVGGNPVGQEFAYNEAYASYGYVVAGATPADDLVFNLADLNGKSTRVSFAAGSTAGSNFVTINSIADQINSGASANGVQITASIDKDTHKMALLSAVPGADGKVTVASASASASANNINSVMGIVPATYANGVGNYAYTAHLKNTKIQLQVGPNEGDVTMCHIARIDCKALGIEDLDLTTSVSATRAITLVDNALNKVNSERSRLGAIENRLTYTSNSLAVAESNMTASESRIRDVDMAQEVIQMTQAQILQQASNAMVAQANTSAQSVLELLR